MLILISIYACSLGNIDRISCDESKDCNTHFGMGYLCEREGKNAGYCVVVQRQNDVFIQHLAMHMTIYLTIF